MDDDAVQAVIDDLNAVTSVPMTVVVNGHTADIDPASVRSWLRPTLDPMTDEPTYAVDQESAPASPGRRCPRSVWARSTPGSTSSAARWSSARARRTGRCADDTAARILQSLQQGAHSVTLELGTDPADLTTETAQSWGITQPIGGNRAWPESPRGRGGARVHDVPRRRRGPRHQHPPHRRHRPRGR